MPARGLAHKPVTMLSHRTPICSALRQSGQMWRTYSTLSRTTTSRIQPTVSAASSSSATASLLQPRPSSQHTVPSSSLVIAFARRLHHLLKDAHNVVKGTKDPVPSRSGPVVLIHEASEWRVCPWPVLPTAPIPAPTLLRASQDST